MCVDSNRRVEEDLAGIGEREILIKIYYVKYIKKNKHNRNKNA